VATRAVVLDVDRAVEFCVEVRVVHDLDRGCAFCFSDELNALDQNNFVERGDWAFSCDCGFHVELTFGRLSEKWALFSAERTPEATDEGDVSTLAEWP